MCMLHSLHSVCVLQYEHVDGFLEQLSRVSDQVNSLLPGQDDDLRPGQLAAEAGLRAHHPIVIVPGGCQV